MKVISVVLAAGFFVMSSFATFSPLALGKPAPKKGVLVAKRTLQPLEKLPKNGKCDAGYHLANCADSKGNVYTCCLPDQKKIM